MGALSSVNRMYIVGIELVRFSTVVDDGYTVVNY
jgi:hypothetical protein